MGTGTTVNLVPATTVGGTRFLKIGDPQLAVNGQPGAKQFATHIGFDRQALVDQDINLLPSPQVVQGNSVHVGARKWALVELWRFAKQLFDGAVKLGELKD